MCPEWTRMEMATPPEVAVNNAARGLRPQTRPNRSFDPKGVWGPATNLASAARTPPRQRAVRRLGCRARAFVRRLAGGHCGDDRDRLYAADRPLQSAAPRSQVSNSTCPDLSS